MELTAEHYRVAKIAYNAYVKQAGGVSLATGAKLPPFDALSQPIKDAWAAAGIAVLQDGDRTRETVDVSDATTGEGFVGCGTIRVLLNGEDVSERCWRAEAYSDGNGRCFLYKLNERGELFSGPGEEYPAREVREGQVQIHRECALQKQ